MKLRNNNILGKSAKTIALFLGASALSLTSCRDNDFDWETAHQNYVQKIESEYAEHFKQIFGEVDPNQTWDFTQAQYGTRGASDFTVTGGYYNEEWYDVLSETRSWLDGNLKETENHQSIGNPFVINVPTDGTFDLIPIYQGFSSSFWDMHMVVQPVSGDPEDVTFWKKNDNIEVQLNPLLTRPNGNYNYLGDHVVKISNKQDNKYMDCNSLSSAQSSRYLITSYNGKKVLYSFGGSLPDVKSLDYTKLNSHPFGSLNDYAYTPSYDSSNGMKVTTSTFCQFYVGDGFKLNANNWYILEAEVYSNGPFSFNAQVIPNNNWSEMVGGSLSGKGGTWQKVKLRFQAKMTHDHNVVFQPSSSINIKNMRIYNDGGEGFMVANDGGVYADLDPNNASEFISYDDYFTLGNYFLYNDGNSLQVYRNTSNKSWDMPEEKRDNKYKWNFERESATDSQKAIIANLRNVYGVTESTKPWVNVQVTASEESTSLTTRAKKYTFSGLPAGAMVYFYWETKMPNWRTLPGNAEHYLSSLNDQMRAFDCPIPLNIPKEKIVKVIGCEAALAVAPESNPSASLGDRDYNDMVFLLVMNEEPKYVPLNEEHEVITEKRYMVEDLGATDDIDFNDMVVDVRQVHKETWTIENGKITSKTIVPNSTEQEVILRAMGGTLDFDFKIGDTKIFTKSTLPSYNNYQTMYKTGMQGGKSTLLDNYNSELYKTDLKDKGNPWNPSTNNVSFTVYKDGKSATNTGVVKEDNEGSYEIAFPNIGDEAPHIIAFPVTKLWRDERHECCSNWLYDEEPALWEMPENTDSPKNTHTENFATWISYNKSVYLNWVKDNFSETVMNSMATWVNKYYPNATSNTEAGE